MSAVICGCDAHYSDGAHSDTNVYALMMHQDHLDHCDQDPDADDSVFSRLKVRELKCHHEIWAKAKGISVTDNGYPVINLSGDSLNSNMLLYVL